MLLHSRLRRIERKMLPADPLHELTDEELEAAMASLKARIEAETGMPLHELAGMLESDMASGRLADELDESAVRVFVDQVKRESRLNA